MTSLLVHYNEVHFNTKDLIMLINIWSVRYWCHVHTTGGTKYRTYNPITYGLITAYLLLRVNLDKIMHARWNFDVSSVQTRRVSALDRHQNWRASALFCLNSRAQSKCAVVNLIHTQRKQTFCLLLCDNQDILVSLKGNYILPTNIITRLENKSTLRSHESTLCDAHAHVSTALDVRSAIVQK